MSKPVALEPFVVEAVDPRSADALRLIARLSAELAERYPFIDDNGAGNFTPADAVGSGCVFLVGRLGDRPAACGALLPLEPGVAEVKRMFVEADCRGRGYAGQVLAELERHAAAMGYDAVRLETGDRQPEAIRLYERTGYRRIANYGIYVDNAWSVCFEKPLFNDEHQQQAIRAVALRNAAARMDEPLDRPADM